MYSLCMYAVFWCVSYTSVKLLQIKHKVKPANSHRCSSYTSPCNTKWRLIIPLIETKHLNLKPFTIILHSLNLINSLFTHNVFVLEPEDSNCRPLVQRVTAPALGATHGPHSQTAAACGAEQGSRRQSDLPSRACPAVVRMGLCLCEGGRGGREQGPGVPGDRCGEQAQTGQKHNCSSLPPPTLPSPAETEALKVCAPFASVVATRSHEPDHNTQSLSL